jgi:hypothetical protein
MILRAIARFGLLRLIGAVIGLAVVLGAYSFLASYYRETGMMAPDESFYAVAARAVIDGELPYRDFAYTQMPILPYLNGLILDLVGFGMDSHRLVNAVWGGLGLVILMAGVFFRTGRVEAAVVTGYVLAMSPRWVSLQALGVWCGPTGALLNLATAAVLWPGCVWRRAAIFAIAGVAAIGCRLSCAPMVAVLALPLLIETGGLKRALSLLQGFVVLGAVALLPFVLSNSENFFFHTWSFHVESGVERNFQAQAMQWWNVAPVGLMVFAIGLFGLPRLIKSRRAVEIALLAAALVGVTTPMIPEGAWGVYIAAAVPLAVAGGVCSLSYIGGAEQNPFRQVIWVLPALSLLLVLPFEVTEGAATEPEEVGAFIRDEVEDGPLLTGVGVVAVEAGREVIAGTEMGAFSALHPRDAALARRAKMTTLVDLTERVLDQEPAAIVKLIDPEPWIVWNFRWALPSLDTQPLRAIYAYEDAISECYEPVWATQTMEVLVRRQPAPSRQAKLMVPSWEPTEAATPDGQLLVRGQTLNRRHDHGGDPVRVGLARFVVENRGPKPRTVSVESVEFLQSHAPARMVEPRGIRIRDESKPPHPDRVVIPAGEERAVEVLFETVEAYQSFDQRFLFRVKLLADGDPVTAAAKLRVARVTPLKP